MKPIFFVCVGAVLFLPACGGGGGSTTPTTPTTNPSSSSCTTGTLTPVNAPNLVTVAGAPANGIDVNVSSLQTCPATNAEVLGVAEVTATQASASNTGAQVSRGDTKIVLLFGPGLSGAMNVSISGQPNDFLISNIRTIQSNDTPPTPGVEFQVTVSPTAALGARTVILQAQNQDLTVFSGGLEVLP